MKDTGFHTLWDIEGAAKHVLQNENLLHDFFRESLRNSGFTILDDLVHKFHSGGSGVTGLFLLSESHLSYHTYPENRYISIDVYTCGRTNDAINTDIYIYFHHAAVLNRRTLARGTHINHSLDDFHEIN
ncbi:adenosylmethionine decarboxylase [Pseudomonas sp. MLB6B]